MVLVEAKNYRFRYPGEEQDAIRIRKLQIEKGSFCVLAGYSGSGKTTLLRQLSGNTGWNGEEEGDLINSAKKTAYVWQNPGSQIVTDRVEYEIVFGLENMGMSKEQMQRRLAEVVTFFGLEDLLNRDTMELSGGEMQTLNVAAAVAMNPELLLLDEPTSQLDPVAARKFYELLRQINEELGITILMAEQRLEDAVLLADTMYLMEAGEIVAGGSVSETWQCSFQGDGHRFFPSYMEIYEKYAQAQGVPLSKKQARTWFENFFQESSIEPPVQEKKHLDFIRGRDLCFRYEKEQPDVLRECSFDIPLSSITCLGGGNGSGKSTLLEILSGRYRAYHGRIKNLPGKKVLLPQQPKYLFLEDRVEECFSKQKKMRELAGYFDLLSLAKRNPSDLSGGELQRLGLCRVLGTEAELYLLDEPTKGMDWKNKIRFGEYLRKMTGQGKTILMVSHDMEFAARYADYMALMFCGRMDLLTDRRNFFEENQFYTTGLNRIARGVSPHIITEEDIDIYAEKKSI